jgi:hypothetical protein
MTEWLKVGTTVTKTIQGLMLLTRIHTQPLFEQCRPASRLRVPTQWEYDQQIKDIFVSYPDLKAYPDAWQPVEKGLK